MSETAELNFVQKARREKLDALIAAGVPPFAYGYERTHDAAAAVASMPEGADEGATVRLAGRLVAWRGHGKTAFAHLVRQDPDFALRVMRMPIESIPLPSSRSMRRP